MRDQLRTTTVAAVLLLVLGAILAAPTPAAAQTGEQKVCEGFDKKHTVTKWGGPKAFSKEGAPSIVELQSYFAEHENDIRAVLSSQGLGVDVANALFETVAQGVRIDERPVGQGERLHWMAYREDGDPKVIETMCVNTKREYAAFEIEVPVVRGTSGGPECRLDVSTDCNPGGESVFEVTSSPGARVTMTGPGGSQTIIEGGGSWSGTIDDPYQAEYTFNATNEGAVTEQVTTYTFLAPKVCINLALIDQRDSEREGPSETCRESETLEPPVCPIPPPRCTIDVDPAEVRRGDPVSYRVTGHWVDLDLEVERDGEMVDQPVLSGDSGSVEFRRAGSYAIVGTATNEVGDTATCRTTVEVLGPDWILRPFVAWVSPDDEEVTTESALAVFPPVRTFYNYDDGYGLGLSVERLFNERVGLEARGVYAILDDEFMIDVGELWEMTDDEADYWNLSLGLNFHLTPESRVDWYVGPFIGYAGIDGNRFNLLGQSVTRDADGDFIWGGQVGLDWPFGDSPWGFHLGARYTDFSVEIEDEGLGEADEELGEIGLDPVTIEVGLSYRF